MTNLLKEIEEKYGEIVAISISFPTETEPPIKQGLYIQEGYHSFEPRIARYEDIKSELTNYFDKIDPKKNFVSLTLWTWGYVVWTMWDEFTDQMTFASVPQRPKHVYDTDKYL